MFRLPASLLTAISRSDIIRGSAPDAQACTSVPGQELAAFFSRGNRLPLHPSEHESANGDLDLADFAKFQNCFTGSEAGPVADGCACANSGEDQDVDLTDFAAFYSAFIAE